MNLEMFAYVLGTVLGGAFIIGIIATTKKVAQEDVKLEFKNSKKVLFMSILTMLMLGLSLSVLTLFQGLGAQWMQKTLALTYWVSMIFIFIYVQSRTLAMTKEGVGYRDIFGRVGKLFYPWNQIEKYDISEKNVTVYVKAGNALKLPINLNADEIKKYRETAKLLMKNK